MDSNSLRLAKEENTRILNELIDFMRNGSVEFHKEFGTPGKRTYRWELEDDIVTLFEPAGDGEFYEHWFPLALLDMSRDEIDAWILGDRKRREAERVAMVERQRAADFERRRQHYETLKKEFENG